MVIHPQQCFWHTHLATQIWSVPPKSSYRYKLTCFLLYLHPPLWESPGSPEFYTATFSPCLLCGNSTQLHKPCFMCCVVERVTKMGGGEDGSNPFPLKTVCGSAVMSCAMLLSMSRTNDLPHLSCKSKLNSGTPQLCSDFPNLLLADALFKASKQSFQSP